MDQTHLKKQLLTHTQQLTRLLSEHLQKAKQSFEHLIKFQIDIKMILKHKTLLMLKKMIL